MPTNNPAATLRETTLGVFLHDIGKFAQRAGWPAEGLSDATNRLIQDMLPRGSGGQFTHHHVLYTAEFFEWLERERIGLPGGLSVERVRKIAVFHHKPVESEPLEWLCAEADRLSAGMERKQRDEQDELAGGSAAGYRHVALLSPFSYVQIDPARSPVASEIPLAALEPGEQIMPQPKVDTKDYPRVYQ